MKTCSKCGQQKPTDGFHGDPSRPDGLHRYCKDCRNEKAAKYRAAHQSEVNARARDRRHADPEKQRAADKRWRDANREARLKRMADYRSRHRGKLLAQRRLLASQLRSEVLAYYGASCACCGEAHEEFLTIDHINGDGAAHRKEIGQGALYRWLKKNGFPEGFRTLCTNCNVSRGRYGYCPHERERGDLG